MGIFDRSTALVEHVPHARTMGDGRWAMGNGQHNGKRLDLGFLGVGKAVEWQRNG